MQRGEPVNAFLCALPRPLNFEADYERGTLAFAGMTVHKPPDEVLLPTVRSHWFASKLSTPIIGIGGAVPRSRKRPRTPSKNTPTPSKKTPAPSKKTPAPCKKTPPLYDRVRSEERRVGKESRS